MTLYKTEELSAILTKAGFTNIEIDTKLGCVTVSARRPVTALDKVKRQSVSTTSASGDGPPSLRQERRQLFARQPAF